EYAMVTTRALAGVLTLAIGGAVYAQGNDTAPTQPAQGTDPNAASSPHQREATSKPGPEAQSTPGANPSTASSPHQQDVTGTSGKVETGMAVEDHSGQSLGSVSNVVNGSGTSHRYVVISSPDGTARAVPAPVANSMTKDGRIVIDRK